MNLHKITRWIACLLIALSMIACAPKRSVDTPERNWNEGGAAPDVALLVEMPPLAPTMTLPESWAETSADKGLPGRAPVLPIEPPVAPGEAETLPRMGDRQMIIKNAEVKLLVADTDLAVDGVTQIAGDVGGYIISSRVWYQDYYGENYKYAVLTLGVPVEQFETTLRRLRGLALRVLDETASGEDVTDQFVDLEAQLKNLEATRDRIRSFLDQAKTVDEALRINQQLSEVEGQIEEIKGRMNYLTNRSAFSTIMVSLEPHLPEITPTATPTPTPTATPTPWSPNQTIQRSRETLTQTYQGLAEFFIWLGIVFLPIVGPWVLLIWVLWRLLRRKPASPTPPTE